MSLILFIGPILFFLYANYNEKGISFVDLYLLYCLYFDATFAFIGSQFVNYIYYQNLLVFSYSIYYFTHKSLKISAIYKKFFWSIVLYLLIIILIPTFNGQSMNDSIRLMSLNYASLIILPIAFHYYSNSGNILNLFRVGYVLIVSWSIIVVIYSLLKIDIYHPLGGNYLGSNTFGMGFIYFGNMAGRGAITYISFFLLLIPFILKRIKRVKYSLIFFSAGLIILVMFTSLKRFTFVVLGLGLLNYLIKSTISKKQKVKIVFGTVSILVVLYFGFDLDKIAVERYEERGGENKFSEEAVSNDLRIFEPIYVFLYLLNYEPIYVLFGSSSATEISINSDLHNESSRKIHNHYAGTLLQYGLFGLFIYLSIFVIIYKFGLKLRRKLIILKIDSDDYWIVFQNLVLIFVIEGMVGGHTHITLRGFILIFAGGILGHFVKMVNQENINERTSTNIETNEIHSYKLLR
jgi:hypothetical protein